VTSFAELEAMRAGARNAVRICMRTTASDRVAVISDRRSSPIARLLVEEASNVGAVSESLQLESFGKRPIRALPEAMRSALLSFRPTVTFFTAASQPGEVAFRMGLIVFLTRDLHVRHGHMVGITPEIMREGMAVDYNLVAKVTRAVYERVRVAQRIQATSADGTNLTAHFDPALRWVPSPGIYHRQGEWGNLPDGETYTCPASVDGVLAARVVGDYFSEKYGYLKDRPLLVTLKESRLVDVDGPEPLRSQFLDYVHSAENGDRVGEFAIGTNIGLKRLIGNMLQDEKYPGIHIAFGDPYPAETGARWASSVHVDLVSPETTIDVDGDIIMRDGEFNFDVIQLECD